MIFKLLSMPKNYNQLNIIRNKVEEILYDPKFIGKKFFLEEFDNSCIKIGKKYLKKKIFTNNYKNVDLFLVSRLQKFGGSSKLLFDLIKNIKNEYLILSTGLFPSEKSLKSKIIECHEVNTLKKLKWIENKIFDLRPRRIWYFCLHQDSVALASLANYDFGKINYIHHCDHNAALGASVKKFKHIDPHIGIYNICKKKNKKNIYMPLVCENLGKINNNINSKNIVTCTVSNYNKNIFKYPKLIENLICNILRKDNLKHIHIGTINPFSLIKLYFLLILNNISLSKFEYFPKSYNIRKIIRKKKVNLFISNFPLAGYRTLIEVMSLGVPIIIEKNLVSNYLSGEIIAPKKSFKWKNYEDIIKFINTLDNSKILHLSNISRNHYMKYYRDDLLIQFLKNKKIPKPIQSRRIRKGNITLKHSFISILINHLRKIRNFKFYIQKILRHHRTF